MAKCLLDIKLDITDNAREKALSMGGFREVLGQRDTLEITNNVKAAVSAREINRSFKEDVITPSVVSKSYYVIAPSEELATRYLDQYNKILENEAKALQDKEMERGGYTEEERGEFFQKEEAPASTASPKTIAVVKDFLNRAGVDIKVLENIVVNGVKQNANGVALITQRLVQVVEGKEATALPEEAMHFAVEIIQQTNPKLFNQLLKEINSYQTLQDVFTAYGNDPNYQEFGKPNVLKLKKEAIAKVLAETIISKNEGRTEKPELLAKVESWWDAIINAIKNLFVKSGFDRAAISVLTGENIGTVEDIRAGQAEMYLQKTTQESIYNKIKDVQASLEQRPDGFYANDKKVPRRVTDLIRDWYERKFKGKEMLKSEYEKAVDETKAKAGMGGHADMQYAFELFVNADGYLRDHPLDDREYTSRLDPEDNEAYYVLRNNLQARLNSFPKNTRFLSRVNVYDPKRGIADTIDFMAITDKGKVSIIDWKFMDIDIEKNKGDVAWYKVGAWKQEMDQYKLILQNAYGIDPKDFEQVRTVPIRTVYKDAPAGYKNPLVLDFIEIGDAKVENIKKDYLIPIGVESESTGETKIDKLLEKLNAVYKRLSEERVLPSERLDKNEQLNALFSAIRQLQMKKNIKPLLYQAKVLNNQLQGVIQKFNTQFKGKDPKSFTEQEINEFSAEIINAENTIRSYTTLDTDLKFLFTGRELSEEDKALRDDLRETVDNARELQSTLREVSDEFVNDVVAGSEDIGNILSPEKIIKGISRLFSSTSTLQIKAMEVLYKKANKAFGYASMDTLTETKNLQKLKEAYDALAQSKGWTAKNYFDIIKKKDKNELIDEFNRDFYSELRTNISGKDITWIKANVDVEAYKKHMEQKLAEEIQRVKDKSVFEVGTKQEIEDKVDGQISYLKKLYNTMGNGAGWLQYDELKKFPVREKWESAEWKELKQNDAALKFYEYIQKKNKEYQELGYISAAEARTFLPYVRKGLVEKLIFGGNISLGEQFMRSISIDEGDVGFGQIDPLTGRPIDTIPVYFTKEIEGELSTDLFRTMALYNEMAIKYKYLTGIEDQARALIETERNKKAIATSYFGKTVYKDGNIQYTPDNNENTKLLEDMVKGIVYGQKYIQSESFDQVLGTLGNFGERANKKLGIKIFPENLEGRQVSVNKSITQLNNFFQTKTLGLNLLSATSNLFGGTAQSIINSGKYFTKSDYLGTESWLLMNKMGGEDKKKAIAALEYFLPLTDNYNREIAKTLSVSKLSQENIQEFLMMLMRNSDMHVQTTNFFSFLKNSIVEDGKVVNAREFLKATPEYADMYAGTIEQRQALEAKFEEDVKQLIEDKGVMKLGSVDENNEFVIPGVERKSSSVIDIRRKVQSLTKDALGSLSDDDLRMINMNIYGKSFMMFKNWIPRLVDVRAGNLKYNSASDAYEWGRMRMVFRVISEDALNSLGNLKNSLQANEKGVAFMKQLFEKKKADYEKETGKTLEMNENEFIDLMRQNLRSQMVDAMFFLTLIALVWGLKANAPDDDEEPRVKNQYKFLMKAADKLRDEISYFYDPTSFSNLVSGGIFPSVSMIDNFKTLTVNFMKENYGLAVGDEELVKKNYVIKYLLRTFPVSSQAAQMLPLFYPDVAKDLGIKAQSQSGFIR